MMNVLQMETDGEHHQPVTSVPGSPPYAGVWYRESETKQQELEADKLLVAKQSTDTILDAHTVPPDSSVGSQLVNAWAVRRHHDPMDLVSLAREVQQADQFVRATTAGKLQVVVDQIRMLQEQAQRILESAKRDTQLHHASCNFTKVPGHTYHLYERSDGTTYFSMLAPKDWGSACPHTYLASYRLEHDRSWTLAEDVEERMRDIDAINRVIHAHTAIGYISRT